MAARKHEASWLGAEAVPGGLAEINRAVQRARDASIRMRVAPGRPRAFGLLGAVARLMGKDRALR